MSRVEPLSNWNKLFGDFNTSALEFYTAVETAVNRQQLPDIEVSRIQWSESGLSSAQREYLRVRRGLLVMDICAAPFGNNYFFSSWQGLLKPGALVPTMGAALACAGLFGLDCYGVYQWLGLASSHRVQFSSAMPIALMLLPLVLLLAFVVVGVLLQRRETGLSPYLLAIPILGWLWEKLFLAETYYRTDQRIMFQSSVHSAVLEVIDELVKTKGLKPLTEEERKPVMKDFFKR